ncbi:MAG: cytochrome b N-terminal domain-containing protein, partial [Planctomycetaceae bacterium]|nr:cytochrome b N-terminal domain-containing protein [Planctomycetaceae bacterium]
MSGFLKQGWDWCEERLGVAGTLGGMLRHPVPPQLGWYYVFGSATLTMFLLQVVTGICLAFVYVPAADEAYTSLEYLNHEQFLGWVLRALHYFGAAGMVVLMAAHMTRVFLMGAFKYPRELTWLIGVGLLCLTLALAFTGQVLRWDQDAYWGVGVGASMIGRVPLLGPYLVDLLLGGATIGGETLSRFFGLHVFILPALTIGLIIVHVYLVLRQGISARPVAGKPVDPRTYHAEYAAQLQAGEPFFPNDFLKDAAFSGLALLVVVGLAISFGPLGPGEPPDPTLISAEPRPDWYFLPLFALLALCPPEIETAVMLGLPLVVG